MQYNNLTIEKEERIEELERAIEALSGEYKFAIGVLVWELEQTLKA